jgi:hypothetical protein
MVRPGLALLQLGDPATPRPVGRQGLPRERVLRRLAGHAAAAAAAFSARCAGTWA